MKAIAKYGLIAILVLGVLAALGFFLTSPLLYSPEKDNFPSRFHDNTGILKLQSVNSSTDVMPLMQDLLDYSGPIVLSIRINDIEQARRDLERFAKSRGSLKNLIVKLDMSESEMQEFSKSKDLQQQLLADLLNSSISLNELDNLEIQYRDRNDPDSLISLQYEGDAIRKKVQDLYNQYKTETAKVTAISTKFGLDTTQEESGLVEFEQYVKEIVRDVDQPDTVNPAISFPANRSAQLTFLIHPDHGVYGDRIECFGHYFSVYGTGDGADREVTVFMDNASLSTLKTDESGSYSVTIPVEHLSTGPHSLYAQSGTTFSDNRTLTISSVGSTTTLSVTRPNTTGEVICTGSVIANIPVRSAPVQLVWDTTHIVGTSTDAQGQFKAILQLPDGKHTLVARFSGEEFPISASESKPQVVDVSLLRIIPFETLAGVLLSLTGILLLFIGIAWYYLRRIPGRRTFDLLRGREPASQRTPATEISGPDGEPGAEEAGASSLDTPLIPDEPVISRYARILKKEGMGGASWAVYRQFARHIAHDLFIPRHTTLTPRELSRFCVQKPFCAAFASFVSTYERIRYGGQRSVAAQTEFETRMHAIQSKLDEGLP